MESVARTTLLAELRGKYTSVTLPVLKEAVNSEFPNFEVIGLDRKFRTLPFEYIERIIALNRVDELKYVTDEFDCDSFARAFQVDMIRRWKFTTAGFVVDVPGVHAYNLIVDADLNVRIFEPQSDTYKKIGDKLSRIEAYTGHGYVLF